MSCQTTSQRKLIGEGDKVKDRAEDRLVIMLWGIFVGGMAAIMLVSILVSVPMPWNERLEISAVVTSIEIRPCGYGSSAIAQVTFDNGQVLPFRQIDVDQFRIGQLYQHRIVKIIDTWREN